MSKRIALLIMFAVAAAAAFSAEKNTIKIEPLKGEKWWGLYAGHTPAEPFLQPFSVNTSDNTPACELVPMLISSAGRYLWSSSPVEVSFDGRTFTVSSADESLQLRRAGRTLREAYLMCRHRNPSQDAPCAVSPELLSNLIYETGNEIGCLQSQEIILGYAARIAGEGLPAGYIVIADGWRAADGAYDFDRTLYPEPESLISSLHEAGFKVMLTVTPYLPASGRTYVSARSGGRLLKDAAGEPVLVKDSDGVHAVLDISDNDCRRSMEESLLEIQKRYGIDAFRFDCQALMRTAPATTAGTASFLGIWHTLGSRFDVHECQPDMAAASYAPDIDAASLGDVLSDVICSSLVKGNETFMPAVSWRYDDQAELLRAMQIAAMLPVPHIPYAPWRISDANLYSQLKNTLSIRASLGEYMTRTAKEADRTAEPLVRHMEYQFPRSGFADCDNQFMLGDRYLIAPPLDGSAMRMVRLPKGVWRDMNGKRYKGPVVINAAADNSRMICFELQTK